MMRAWIVDLAGGSLLAAMLAGGYFLGVRSGVEARAIERSTRQEIDTLRAERATIDQDIAMLAEDLAMARERAASGVRLRREDERNSVLAEVSRVATDGGLVVDELAPGDRQDVDGLVRTTIRLRARGGVAGVMRFAGGLREELAGVTIRTLDIAGDPFSDGDDRVVSVELAWLSERASVENR